MSLKNIHHLKVQEKGINDETRGLIIFGEGICSNIQKYAKLRVLKDYTNNNDINYELGMLVNGLIYAVVNRDNNNKFCCSTSYPIKDSTGKLSSRALYYNPDIPNAKYQGNQLNSRIELVTRMIGAIRSDYSEHFGDDDDF